MESCLPLPIRIPCSIPLQSTVCTFSCNLLLPAWYICYSEIVYFLLILVVPSLFLTLCYLPSLYVLLNWTKCERFGKKGALILLETNISPIDWESPPKNLGTSLQGCLAEWKTMPLKESQGRKCLLLTKALNIKQSRENWKQWILVLPHVGCLQSCQWREDSQKHALFIVRCEGQAGGGGCKHLCSRGESCALLSCLLSDQKQSFSTALLKRYLLLSDYTAELTDIAPN